MNYQESSEEEDFADADASFNNTLTPREARANNRAISGIAQAFDLLGTGEEEPFVDHFPNLPPNAIMPPAVVDFEVENGDDTAGAMDQASRYLHSLAWSYDDLAFYFTQAEVKMASAGVKKQFTKFQILTMVIPTKIQNQVKPLLRMKESDFTNNDSYKRLKDEILRIFGPRPEAAVERALNRVLTSTPGALARKITDDICEHNLTGCCCPKIVRAIWQRHLPSNVKAGIAHSKFNKDTFNTVLQLADDIFETTGGASQIPSVAAVQQASLDETQPAIPYATAEVAATNFRGRGRGARGRGRGRGRGQQAGQASSGDKPRFRGPKHPDLPSGDWSGCQMHHRWGRGAFFCSEPLTCPWKNVIQPKPTK